MVCRFLYAHRRVLDSYVFHSLQCIREAPARVSYTLSGYIVRGEDASGVPDVPVLSLGLRSNVLDDVPRSCIGHGLVDGRRDGSSDGGSTRGTPSACSIHLTVVADGDMANNPVTVRSTRLSHAQDATCVMFMQSGMPTGFTSQEDVERRVVYYRLY